MVASGMMWMAYDRLNKFYSFYMADVVGVVSMCGLTIEMRHRNQPNKTKPVPYKLLLLLKCHLKQLYIHNKRDHFDYEGGCGIRVLRHLKEELV